MEKRNPKIVIAPKGCDSYFTEGKEYQVVGFWEYWDDTYGYGIILCDDYGDNIDCLQFCCAHLNGGDWIVKEYENSLICCLALPKICLQ